MAQASCLSSLIRAPITDARLNPSTNPHSQRGARALKEEGVS
jgi:hypothetical protein